MTDLSALYQTDYAAWAQGNAELLRAGRYASAQLLDDDYDPGA